jgi:putative phosphoribosyl transferase
VSFHVGFADRAEAGRLLAAVVPVLEHDALVLGMTRGGVPVAAEVARELGASLDVLVVRKVGHPAQPEYALGAVSEDGVVLPSDLPEELVRPQLELAADQARRLRGDRPREPLAGRAVVVVDDGLATGRSMRVALESARRGGASRVVMAVPVAAAPGFYALSQEWEACAVHVVESPEFFAVGQFFEDFAQVDDETVASLLAATAADAPGGPDAP